MLNHYLLSTASADKEIENIIKLQCTDPSSPHFGVLPDINKGYTEPAEGCGCAAKLITAYYDPAAARYKDPVLLERAGLAIDFTLSRINGDGSIDLMETNFHDATYNGFAMHNLGPAVLVMQQFSAHTPAEDELYNKCLSFVNSSKKAMIDLGFHTPNHRWVLSAALAYCLKITEDECCREHINKFLAEGIDCDENGEYTERSAGVYNVICNRCLMIMADMLDIPELLQHVTRNLEMSQMYFEPDGTVNTLNSTRQDMGRAPDCREYYGNFLTMALMEKNGEFAYIADQMLKKTLGQFDYCGDFSYVTNNGFSYIPQRSLFLLHPEWNEAFDKITPAKPRNDYEKHFEGSGIVRKRIGNATLTLIKDRPLFCSLQVGSHRINMRFAGSFFGCGQFKAQSLEKYNGGYRLHMKSTADYKRPFDTPPETSVWAEMNHSLRKNVAVQEFDITFDITLTDRRFTADVKACGCENVPLKYELILEPEGLLDTENVSLFTRAGDYIYLKSGNTAYTYPDGASVCISGAYGAHNYGKNMRNSVFGEETALTLAMTDFSPSGKTITIYF